MDNSIKQFSGPHRWLSNFAACKVTFDGMTYPSTECAYQAAKTLDLAARESFMSMTPGQSKRAGQRLVMRSDWDLIKLGIMFQINSQKYKQEPYRSKLLKTGTAYIQEGNTWGDTFWGVCKGRGKNHLGLIIMRIRRELREANNG